MKLVTSLTKIKLSDLLSHSTPFTAA